MRPIVIIGTLTLVPALVLLASPARAARFGGRLPASRLDVATAATTLLQSAGALPPAPVSLRAPLSDVAPADLPAAAAAVHLGLLGAVGSRFFGEDGVTRLQLAGVGSALARRLELPSSQTAIPPYPHDVPLDHGARDAVVDVLARGLLSMDDGRFDGTASATRYDLARLMAGLGRAASLPRLMEPPRLTDLGADHPTYDDVLTGLSMGLLTPVRETDASPASPVAETSPAPSPSLPAGPVTTDPDVAMADLEAASRQLERRQVGLMARLINLEDRFRIGEPSAPRVLHEVDEEWTAVDSSLHGLLLDLTRVLTAPGPRHPDELHLRRRRLVAARLGRLAAAVERARWRIRPLAAQALKLP